MTEFGLDDGRNGSAPGLPWDFAPEAPENRRSKSPRAHTRIYEPGDMIGDRYRLVKELASGGMGVVWAAESLLLKIEVALKLIKRGGDAPDLADRIEREAQAAARCSHPALVRVFDFGWTDSGDPYLVMELVRGVTLSSLVGNGACVSAIEAVRALLPVIDGLRLAHSKGIVHRDIKPDNILIQTDTLGRRWPKLLDFGIAKYSRSPENKLTRNGTVIGTPEYMSPEQAIGREEVDQRTDVWSLCVVLYELVMGRTPFRQGNYNAQVQAIIHQELVLTSESDFADAAFWQVVARGLCKNRTDRFASMTELGDALALWLLERGVTEDWSGNALRAVWLDPGSQPPRLMATSTANAKFLKLARKKLRLSLKVEKGCETLAIAKNSKARPRVALVSSVLGACLALCLVAASTVKPAPAPPPIAKASAPLTRSKNSPPASTAVDSPAKRHVNLASARPVQTTSVADVGLAGLPSTSPKKSTAATHARPPRSPYHDLGF